MFAPVDDAFAKIDAATIDSLKTDSATLSSILTYHVVPGQIDPADHRRHPHHRAGRRCDGHGQRRRPHGQRRKGDLRRRPDRERDRVPHRHGPDAPGPVTGMPDRPGGAVGRGAVRPSMPLVAASAAVLHATRRRRGQGHAGFDPSAVASVNAQANRHRDAMRNSPALGRIMSQLRRVRRGSHRRASRRPLPARAAHRRGRDGTGVSRGGHRAGPDRRGEGPAQRTRRARHRGTGAVRDDAVGIPQSPRSRHALRRARVGGATAATW